MDIEKIREWYDNLPYGDKLKVSASVLSLVAYGSEVSEWLLKHRDDILQLLSGTEFEKFRLPITTRDEARHRRPFHDLEVGEAFRVPAGTKRDNLISNVSYHNQQAVKKGTGRRWTWKAHGNGYVVQRIR